MIASRIRRTMQVLLIIELLSLCVAFAFCYFAFYDYISTPAAKLPYKPQSFMFFFITGFTVSIITAFVHFFSELRNFVDYANSSILMYFRTSVITHVIVWGFGMLAGFFFFSIGATYLCFVFLLAACLLNLPLAIAAFYLIRKAYSSPLHQLNVLLVGINRRSLRFAEQLKGNSQLGFALAGFIDDENNELVAQHEYLGKFEDIKEVFNASNINLVLFFLPVRSHYDTCNNIAKMADSLGIPAQSTGDIYNRPTHDFAFFSIADIGHAVFNARSQAQLGIFLRRSADLFAGLLLSIIFLIPSLAVIGHVYVRGGSPVFLMLENVGLHKRIFRRYKIRTHQIDPSNPESTLPISGSYAKTAPLISFGGLMRALWLDKLPYSFNLVMGNMTLIGPKALTLEEFGRLTPQQQEERSRVKPGFIGI